MFLCSIFVSLQDKRLTERIQKMNKKFQIFLFGKEQKINWKNSSIYVRFGFIIGTIVLVWAALRNMGVYRKIWSLLENIIPESIYQSVKIKLESEPYDIVFYIAEAYIAALIILSYCQVIKMRDFTRVLFYFLLFLLFVEFGLTYCK